MHAIHAFINCKMTVCPSPLLPPYCYAREASPVSHMDTGGA
jgi:hypothetical protein